MKIIPPNCSTEIHFPLIRLKNSLLTKDFGDTYKKMQKLILGLFSEYEDKKLGYKISIMKDSLQILLSILRNLEYETISPERNHKIYKKMSFMKAVNKYIENNFTNKITLSDISEHCGYSLYYFAHFFKETTNRSFFDYLSDFRAEKARQLILISDKKLIDIAFLCGFNNLTSFNRVFKKKFNISPSEYRKIVTG